MMYNCKCGNQVYAISVPCPDGLVGCLVFHYDPNSLICSKCGEDHRQKNAGVTFFEIKASDYDNLTVPTLGFASKLSVE